MKAAVFYGKQDLRCEEVEEPSPGPGEVKIRNAYSGICGSDLHIFNEPDSLGSDLSKPHPVTGATLPQILGHEFAGTIVEVGEGVEDYAVGDRVAVWPTYYCGKCAACAQGLYNACTVRGLHGMHSHGGGIAEYTTVPTYMLHRLPENVDLRMGALVQPMAVSWHGVKLANLKPGDTALVIGAGPVGIGLWFALRAFGVEKILVSEPNPSRRETMARLGADVVDPTSDDVNQAVSEMTDGLGVSAAFDAAGVSAAFNAALQAVKPGGLTVILALYTKPVELMPMSLVSKEMAVVGSSAYLPEDFDGVIAAMADGVFDFTGWVEEVEIEQTAEAIDRLAQGSGSKILIRTSADFTTSTEGQNA
ncbi:2,3-butanediol dehydrogenase [Citricoccus sp. GCM10030269]|uniref:2,3-butanediol dehydrogenase n=1 Tax=Citricoccus sp. GCM10030269 TaxID=3273388 RepID=UPI00361A697D